MIGDGEDPRWICNLATRFSERVKRRRPGPFMQEDAVDSDHRTVAAQISHDMAVP